MCDGLYIMFKFEHGLVWDKYVYDPLYKTKTHNIDSAYRCAFVANIPL